MGIQILDVKCSRLALELGILSLIEMIQAAFSHNSGTATVEIGAIEVDKLNYLVLTLTPLLFKTAVPLDTDPKYLCILSALSSD